MSNFKDIYGNLIVVGQRVLYARKQNYSANGEMIECIIYDIKDDYVRLIPVEQAGNSIYRSTQPSSQIYILPEKKSEKTE